MPRRQLDLQDLVAHRVAGDDQPASVAHLVIPELAMCSGRVVANILVVEKDVLGIAGLPVGPVEKACIAEIDEFL